jgi:hypothetical protein
MKEAKEGYTLVKMPVGFPRSGHDDGRPERLVRPGSGRDGTLLIWIAG